MIEVSTFVSGRRHDTATALDPAAAVTAARQLIEDAESAGVATTKLLTRFYVDGKMVRQVRGAVIE